MRENKRRGRKRDKKRETKKRKGREGWKEELVLKTEKDGQE